MLRSDRAGPILAAFLLLLSACVTDLGGPSVSPTFADVSTRPLPTGSAAASAPASDGASASASASEAPSATATADPSVLDLEVTSCDGGVVLEWSPSTHPDFHHYTALRSPEREIAPHYPPIAPAVDWGDTYATDRFVNSAADASLIPSGRTFFYRVMAYDADGAVVGASNVHEGRMDPVDELGGVETVTDADGHSTVGWQPYAGFSRCFSHYRVLYGTTWPSSTVLGVVSGQDSSSLATDALHPGTTYLLRVEAMRTTTLGAFVVGTTETVTYTVP